MMSTVTRILFALDANLFANVMYGIVSWSFMGSKTTQPKVVEPSVNSISRDGAKIRVSEIPIVSKSLMDSVAMSVVPHSGHWSASSAMISVVHFRFLHFMMYCISLITPVVDVRLTFPYYIKISVKCQPNSKMYFE